jgi:phenylalanyl-tRNA synthetase beta chain
MTALVPVTVATVAERAPDRSALRPSLIPNLLEAVAGNLRYASSFELFEVGTVFAPGGFVAYHDRFEPMPRQSRRLAAALVGSDGPALFRRAKGVLEMLRRHCHLTDLQFTDATDVAWADQSARLGVTANGVLVGTLALLTTRCRRLAEITAQVACFEVDLGAISAYESRENRYSPVPELPDADFDLSVIVADSIGWNRIHATVANANELIHDVAFIDEFRGTWVPDGHRSVTLRVTLRPTQTTLSADDIAAARGQTIAVLERDLGARLRE